MLARHVSHTSFNFLHLCMPMQIAIVDDKSVNRNTVKQKLCVYEDVVVCMEASNGEDFLSRLKDLPLAKHPQLVLMDLDMPVMDGIETIRRASAAYPEMKFVVLTIYEDTERIFEAIRAGANGYLLKDDKATQIFDAITNVLEFNGVPMSPSIARKAMELLMQAPKPELKKEEDTDLGLSNREMDILKALASGDTYNQIGEKLFISPLTVRKHVANLYAKLHVSSRAQIINIAHKNKLI
jgi:DNA-binding NarL/FixJ family response regulator